METNKAQGTKNLILANTLKILGTEGPTGITIRRIAQESGVNIASINYHFGSKEVLMGETMKFFGKEIKRIFQPLQESSIAPETRLRTFLEEFSTLLVKYPGFMKTQVQQLGAGKKANTHALENMKFGKEQLCLLVEKLTEIHDASTIEKLSFQLMAGIILPVLHTDFVELLYNIDFNKPEDRAAMIDMAIEKLLAYGKK